MTGTIELGPRSQAWGCNDCRIIFIWHPGATDHERPTECPTCEGPNIIPAEVEDEHDSTEDEG